MASAYVHLPGNSRVRQAFTSGGPKHSQDMRDKTTKIPHPGVSYKSGQFIRAHGRQGYYRSDRLHKREMVGVPHAAR